MFFVKFSPSMKKLVDYRIIVQQKCATNEKRFRTIALDFRIYMLYNLNYPHDVGDRLVYAAQNCLGFVVLVHWFYAEVHFLLPGHVNSKNIVYRKGHIGKSYRERHTQCAACVDICVRNVPYEYGNEYQTVNMEHYVMVLEKCWTIFKQHWWLGLVMRISGFSKKFCKKN